MFERSTTAPSATPEEMLDAWLDAMNDSDGSTPPPPPDDIAGLAAVAREYRQTLGTAPTVATNRPTITERNGSMNHALPLATPISRGLSSGQAARRSTARRPEPASSGWLHWLTNGLATAMVIGLLLSLGGAMILQQTGMPGGADDPTRAPSVAASPEALPENGSLSCGAPGYRPVIEGDVNEEILAMIGAMNDPVVIGDDEVTAPMTNGESLSVPRGSSVTVDPRVIVTHPEDDSTTVTRLSDGTQWDMPAADARTFDNDRYYVSPTDGSLTNWIILDVLTGEQTTTADILGEPFEFPITPRYNPSVWSDDRSVMLLDFNVSALGDEEQEPAAAQPGVLVIPGSLSDAYFKVLSPTTTVSPDGTLLLSYNQFFHASTGEPLTDDNASGMFDGTPIAFTGQSSRLLVFAGHEIRVIQPTNSTNELVYTADAEIQSVGYDRSANTLVIGTGTAGAEAWIWFDLDTGDRIPLPELGAYRLSTPSGDATRTVDRVAQFTKPAEESPWTIRGLDMESGKVSEAISHFVDPEQEWIVRTPYIELGAYLAAQDASGGISIISPDTGTQIRLGTPPGVDLFDDSFWSLSVSPSGACAVLNNYAEQDNTYIAPIEPGATWMELDVKITKWVEIPDDSGTETLPAQEIASPIATPAAGSALSCSAPGYRPIIEDDVNEQALASIGVAHAPIVIGEDRVTVPLADGGERTIPRGTYVTFDPGAAVTHHADGSSTVTRLSDGTTWSFEPVENPLDGVTIAGNGRYYVAPTDDTATNWHVLDTHTGERTTTADILGEPFESPLTPQLPRLDSRYLGQSQSSDDLSVYIISFGQSITGAVPTGPNDITPGALVIPGSISGAWFEVLSPYSIVSPGGEYLASYTEIIETDSGETFTGVPDDGFRGHVAGPFIAFTGDEPTMLTYAANEVRSVHPSTGGHEIVFEADGPIQAVGYDRAANSLVVGAGQPDLEKWTWLDLDTGEAMPLPELEEYHLNRTSEIDSVRYLTGVADFVQADAPLPASGPVDYRMRALDMESGELSASATSELPGREYFGYFLPARAYNGFVATEGSAGSFTVLQPGMETSLVIPKPANVDLDTDQHIGLSGTPSGECLMLNTSDEEFNWTHQTYVAPIEPGATWTELDVRIRGWVEIPNDTGTETLPAQEVALIASPEASPSAEATALSCSAPGYRPVVFGNVDSGALAAIGFTGDPIVAADDSLTITLPDGGEITLPPNSIVLPESGAAFTHHDDNSMTITRLSDGETWEFPALEPRGENYSGFTKTSRYFIGPNNQEWTDWLIVDVLTGETTTTTEILGEPFEGQLAPWSQGESANGDVAVVEFLQSIMGDETPESHSESPGMLVIPGDLDDAYFRTSGAGPAASLPHISPEGTWLATDTELVETATGETVADLSDVSESIEDVVGFVSEAPILVMKTLDSILTVAPLSNEQAGIYQAEDYIRTGAFDPGSQAMVFHATPRGPERWIWMSFVTGETKELPELDGYALVRSPQPFGPIRAVDTTVAFVHDDDSSRSLRAIDMASGNVSTAVEDIEPGSVDNSRYLLGDVPDDYVIARDNSGNFVIIDPSNDSRVVTLAPPDTADLPEDASFALGISPNGSCVLATAHDGEEVISSSYIAPLEPHAEWTELEFTLGGWLELHTRAGVSKPEAKTLPSQNLTPPVATPAN